MDLRLGPVGAPVSSPKTQNRACEGVTGIASIKGSTLLVYDHYAQGHMLARMNDDLRKLPLEERIRLVEDLWDSIAADQSLLPLTPEQRSELDRRLDTYQADGNPGRLAEDVIADIKKKL